VAGDADDPLAGKAPFQLGQPARQRGVLADARRHPVQRVDHRIAGDVDARGIDLLGLQRPGRRFGRREMQAGDGADDLAVNLFGPGVVDIARPQPGLDMVDRHLAVIGGQRPAHRRRRIALHHHPRQLGTGC